MNIISGNKNILCIVICLFILSAFIKSEELDSDSNRKGFGFSMETMGGYSYNLQNFKFKAKRLSMSPSVRLLWNSNRRLDIGIESMYLKIAESDVEVEADNLGKGKISAKLEAIPILLVFKMKLLHLDWTAGIGTAFMMSNVEILDDETKTTTWHYCFKIGLGYTYDFSKYFGTGIEVKALTFTSINRYAAGAYLKFKFTIN